MTKSTTTSASTSETSTSLPSGSKAESSSEPTPLQNEGESTDLSATAMLVQRVTKRENSRDKAKRYLVEARLQVVRVDGDLIVAKCRGGGIVYDLGHEPGAVKPWRCTCPARGPCAHLLALQCVTAVER